MTDIRQSQVSSIEHRGNPDIAALAVIAAAPVTHMATFGPT
ncbi:hypothetical protein OSH11_18775 [Kaistia dalseonensis]|nr:hypothetical protein [Kaistia dalseonensis]